MGVGGTSKACVEIASGRWSLKWICRSFIMLCFWYCEQKGLQKLVPFLFRKYKLFKASLGFCPSEIAGPNHRQPKFAVLMTDIREPAWTLPVLILACLTVWTFWVSYPGRDDVLSSPKRPGRLWHSVSHLFIRYRSYFSGGKAAGAWSWPLTPILRWP